MAGKAVSGGVAAGAAFDVVVHRAGSISGGVVADSAFLFDEIDHHLAAAKAANRAGDDLALRRHVQHLYNAVGQLKGQVGRPPEGQDAQAFMEEQMARGREYGRDLRAEAVRKTGLSPKTVKRWGDKIQR